MSLWESPFGKLWNGVSNTIWVRGDSVTTVPNTIYFSTVANGWTLQLTMPGLIGGTFDVGTDSAPKVSVAVTSKSWTAAGVETTISRTVYGKAMLRKPYPNQASRDETASSPNVIENIVLSDFIYTTDTIQSITVLAGFFTDNGSGGSGLANATETLTGVTNNSTVAYPLPIACWINHDLDRVEATSYVVSLAVAHQHFRSGLPVRAVKFIATDTSANTTSTTISTMTKMSWTASGLSAPVFQGTLDFTGLTQGQMVTIDAIIYPRVGDAFQVSVSGDTYPSPNLTVLKCLNDKTGAYGKVYAYVDAVGGGTPAVSTNPITAATTPYSTIALAAAAIQTYNNANFSRNNISGGVIRLTATTHIQSVYSARAVGEIPLLIEAADAANKSTTIYQDAEAASGQSAKKVKIKNVVLRQTGNYLFLYHGGTKTDGSVFIFDSCTFNINGKSRYDSWITDTGITWLINCDGDDCGQAHHYSTNCKPVLSIGSGRGSIQSCTYSAVGCKDLGAYSTQFVYNSSNIAPQGSFFGCNFLSRADRVMGLLGADISGGSIGARGFALVGNVFEITADTGSPVFDISSAAVNPVSNFLDQGNTFVGNRSNMLYNDSGTVGYAKIGISSQSIHNEWNSKSDVFGTNASLIGNWTFIYRVGSKYRVCLRGSTGTDIPGVGVWLGEVAARGDINGSNAVPIVVDFVNDQSFSGGKAGNGDYTPGANTALTQIPAGETAYPWDLYGRAIPTDGTAFVGAVQKP